MSLRRTTPPSDLSWLNPTPHAIAVYASRPLSPGLTQHSYQAGAAPYLGVPPAGLHRLAWRTHSITSLAAYLPSFQISDASFQSLPIFSHTTRYLPVTSCGEEPLVLRPKVPISRAAEGPSGLTSRVISFGSLTCSAMLFHSASIAVLPFTMPEPGGNAVASSVYSEATPAKITLVEEVYPFRVHRLNLGFLSEPRRTSAATNIITSAILRMTHGS
jgi:hypothetical protein